MTPDELTGHMFDHVSTFLRLFVSNDLALLMTALLSVVLILYASFVIRDFLGLIIESDWSAGQRKAGSASDKKHMRNLKDISDD